MTTASQSVKIVTDSTSDILPDEAKRLGITIVPLTITIDGQSYRDGVDITAEEFYQKLKTASKLPTTSQPSVGAFTDTFKELTADGSQVISVHISSKLSGTYNSARLAAENFPDGQIVVIDSTYVTGALALPLLTAARAAKEGQQAPAIVEKLKASYAHLDMLAVADTLEYLKKGGRIGGLQALAGSLLSVKPIFTIKGGEVSRYENVRTKRKALERIAEIAKGWGEASQVTIMHADAPDEAGELANLVASAYPLKDIYMSLIGPVVGTYAGPKTLGICVERKS